MIEEKKIIEAIEEQSVDRDDTDSMDYLQALAEGRVYSVEDIEMMRNTHLYQDEIINGFFSEDETTVNNALFGDAEVITDHSESVGKHMCLKNLDNPKFKELVTLFAYEPEIPASIIYRVAELNSEDLMWGLARFDKDIHGARQELRMLLDLKRAVDTEESHVWHGARGLNVLLDAVQAKGYNHVKGLKVVQQLEPTDNSSQSLKTEFNKKYGRKLI